MVAKILSAVLGGLCVCAPAAVRADVVLDWNLTMTMVVGGQNPFAQTRFAAITQLAVFEAVNAIEGHYQGYLPTGTIAASSDPRGLSWTRPLRPRLPVSRMARRKLPESRPVRQLLRR